MTSNSTPMNTTTTTDDVAEFQEKIWKLMGAARTAAKALVREIEYQASIGEKVPQDVVTTRLWALVKLMSTAHMCYPPYEPVASTRRKTIEELLAGSPYCHVWEEIKNGVQTS